MISTRELLSSAGKKIYADGSFEVMLGADTSTKESMVVKKGQLIGEFIKLVSKGRERGQQLFVFENKGEIRFIPLDHFPNDSVLPLKTSNFLSALESIVQSQNQPSTSQGTPNQPVPPYRSVPATQGNSGVSTGIVVGVVVLALILKKMRR